MKVAVAGTGYVGLVTGVALAHIGHFVTCVDIDENKVELMRSGKSPIYEKDIEKLMVQNSERLNYTINFREAYRDADVIIIGVGTPEREDGSANLDFVHEVINQILEVIENEKVIVIKSTVPIGTNDKIELYCQNILSKKGLTVSIVSNPEFLAQGTAVHNTLFASRIVVGVENDFSRKVMRELYKPLTEGQYNVTYLEMDRKSAEMVKYASNDFLALKISYINEVSNLCEQLGANIENVSKGMGCDERVGNKFLNPGIGYGGSCFPKDTKALHWLSKSLGKELKTVSACIKVNDKQKIHLIERLLEEYDELKGIEFAILGATFKPGTDDLREAPSIENIQVLLDYGAKVTIYDPIGLENMYKIFANKIEYAKNIDEAIKDKDIAMIMTEWAEIKHYPLGNYEKLMRTPNVYDGRNCYPLEDIMKTKIHYISIGRKTIN